MSTRAVVEKNISLVEQYYPGLRMSNRWEWTHKVAWLSYLDTLMVGQKSTSPTSPVSEDTIGILTSPISGDTGSNYYPMTFEAVDLVNGTSGALQWMSYGLVSQNFIIPHPADVSLIPGGSSEPEPDAIPWVPYWGDEFSDRLGNILVYDYSRRPQLLDAGVSRWISRVFHSAFFGPDKIPLGMDAAIDKHRPEWCAALGVPLTPLPPELEH